MVTGMNRREFLRLSAIIAIEGGLFLKGFPHTVFASPAEKEGLAYLTAIDQIKYYKQGKLSPVDVLNAQIERIKKYNGPLNTTGDELKDFMNFNGKVNAIAYEHFEQAMDAAIASERRYKNGNPRSLEGVTVAVKDENAVRGWRVSMGSLLFKDSPLIEENCAIIDMLLAEGAIMHIQTTVPEFYIHTQTWSRLWGVTRNPWNLYYAVGGSWAVQFAFRPPCAAFMALKLPLVGCQRLKQPLKRPGRWPELLKIWFSCRMPLPGRTLMCTHHCGQNWIIHLNMGGSKAPGSL